MKRLLFALSIGLLPGYVFGQTNDHFWRSYAWGLDTVSARDAGLGGATVALGDDATLANPAGLGTLTKSEVSGFVATRGSGTFDGRDPMAGSTGLGFAGGGALLTQRWAVGGYISRPTDSQTTLAPLALGPGTSDAGRLQMTITDVAAAVAWSPLSHLHFGLRVNVVHLDLSGEWDQTLSGVKELRVGTASGSTKLVPSVGALFDLNNQVRLGFVATPGASWSASRTAVNPVLGLNLDLGSTYSVRMPTTVRLGVGIKASDQVMLVGELDYVRLSEIQNDLSITQGEISRSQYQLSDGVDARAGVEVSLPVRSVSLQLRGGVVSLAPRALTFTGPDPIEAAAFQGIGRQTLGTAGLSIVTKAGVRLDGAGTFGGDQTLLLGGIAVRF